MQNTSNVKIRYQCRGEAPVDAMSTVFAMVQRAVVANSQIGGPHRLELHFDVEVVVDAT